MFSATAARPKRSPLCHPIALSNKPTTKTPTKDEAVFHYPARIRPGGEFYAATLDAQRRFKACTAPLLVFHSERDRKTDAEGSVQLVREAQVWLVVVWGVWRGGLAACVVWCVALWWLLLRVGF